MFSYLFLIYQDVLTQFVHEHGQVTGDKLACTACYRWIIDQTIKDD